MALSLQYTPGNYFSAHGDLIFTIVDIVKASNPSIYPNYKYVCDIFINSVQAARLKSIPRPDNRIGIFNIGNIVRNYLGAILNPTANQLRAQEIGVDEFFVDVDCQFGEEYAFTLYPNLLTDTTRQYYNHYNGRLIGQNTSLVNYFDKVLTTRPTATPVYRNSKFNFIPFLPTDDSDVTLIIKSYNSNGLINTLSQAYTPQGANVLQLYNLSPVAINATQPGFISDYIQYYTVDFSTPNIVNDSQLRFDLVDECKFEVFTLHFMNRFSGFESRNFTKLSRKTISIDKSEFGKLPYTMDSSGIISYYNSNNVYNETKAIYASLYKEKMVLNTDLLTDAEYLWMSDLLLSPLVYLELNDYFIPIALTDNDYEFKKTINDKLTSLTLNVEFGDQFNAQFR